MNVSREDIDHVVGQIVERFAPQRILLFGSRAYGELTVSSDVDLLVIMEKIHPCTPPRASRKS